MPPPVTSVRGKLCPFSRDQVSHKINFVSLLKSWFLDLGAISFLKAFAGSVVVLEVMTAGMTTDPICAGAGIKINRQHSASIELRQKLEQFN